MQIFAIVVSLALTVGALASSGIPTTIAHANAADAAGLRYVFKILIPAAFGSILTADRLVYVAALPGLPMPRPDPTPTARRLPPALLMRYLLHRKGLLLLDALRATSPAR